MTIEQVDRGRGALVLAENAPKAAPLLHATFVRFEKRAYDRSLNFCRQGTRNVELLPAQRDTRILKRRGSLTERILHAHDAAIIACPDENAESALKTLPHAPLWLKLYRDAAKGSAPRHLSARLGPHATPVTVVFTKSSSAAFERLTSAGRAWKELCSPAEASVLL